MIEATCVEGNFNYYNFDLEPLPEGNQTELLNSVRGLQVRHLIEQQRIVQRTPRADEHRARLAFRWLRACPVQRKILMCRLCRRHVGEPEELDKAPEDPGPRRPASLSRHRLRRDVRKLRHRIDRFVAPERDARLEQNETRALAPRIAASTAAGSSV
jgi:hypothetical protein